MVVHTVWNARAYCVKSPKSAHFQVSTLPLLEIDKFVAEHVVAVLASQSWTRSSRLSIPVKMSQMYRLIMIWGDILGNKPLPNALWKDSKF